MKSEKEMGSFIEMQFPSQREYYKGTKNIARLNSGRAAICHALRITGCKAIWLPWYQCDSVGNFLERNNVYIKLYYIDENFQPIDIRQAKEDAVLLVNYYGIMSRSRMEALAASYRNVILDNSQAFFAQPIKTCLNVYSARKFAGVPDGAYVIGANAEMYMDEYPQGYSSDTSQFLLERIEYGCEGKAYRSRMKNEKRLDVEGICKMSKLTRTILDGTDYEEIIVKRQRNFQYAEAFLAGINKLDPRKFYDSSCVPMVYPLVLEEDTAFEKLLERRHFQGHWWSYLLEIMEKDTVEYRLSRYLIPVTIDQRYGERELEDICGILLNIARGNL